MHCVYVPSLLYSSQLRSALKNTVQLILREKEKENEDSQKTVLVLHILRSIIICLRRKDDFAHSLLTTNDPHQQWQSHIHYTIDPAVENPESSRPSSAVILTTDSHSSPNALIQTPLAQQTAQQSSPNPSTGRSSIQGSGRHPLHFSPPSSCFVHAGECSVEYGFEYCGPAQHVILTPSIESGVRAIVCAFAQHSFPRVVGEEKMATVRQASKV